MQIAGFQELTLIDFPGHLASLVFTAGCPFRCVYCHNSELVIPEKIKNASFIPEEKIFEFLNKRKKLIEGVTITGGEPTIQPDLKNFIKKIKNLGLLVKLDSNGVSPEKISELLKEGLLDYIAMDIKSSFEKYISIVGQNFDKKNIEKSIKIIKNSKIHYEFRTTVLPYFHDENEIHAIGEIVKNAENWYLQQFENKNVLDKAFEKEFSYSEKELEKLLNIAKKYVKNAGIRGL